MAEPLTLGSVLKTIDNYPWYLALYLPRAMPWTLDSQALVLDPNDCEEAEEEPSFAKSQNFRYALTIQDLQGIADNARAQRQDLGDQDLLAAFLYYWEHDAYLQF
jgi:hypothetical protein